MSVSLCLCLGMGMGMGMCMCKCVRECESMFVTGLFVSAAVHTTLPLTSSFLISLAVQFLCVSRFCFCVLSGAVYVYVYVYNVCLYVCVECVWKDGERTVSRAKSRETLVEASRDTKAQIVRYTWVFGRKTNRTISQVVPSNVSPQ